MHTAWVIQGGGPLVGEGFGVRIIDGDTLETSLGRERLFGIDAPARGHVPLRTSRAVSCQPIGAHFS